MHAGKVFMQPQSAPVNNAARHVLAMAMKRDQVSNPRLVRLNSNRR